MSEAAAVPMAESKPPSRSLIVAPVPTPRLGEVWDLLVPMLSRIPEMGSRYSLEDVRGWLEAETLQAWGIVDQETNQVIASFYTEVVVYPAKRVLRIPYVAGAEMERWIGFLPSFEQWAWGQGFEEIELQGRPGWERVTGYRERFRTFVKERPDG